MLSSVQGCIHYPCSGMACTQMRYANAAAYVLQASLNFCCWQLEWHALYIYGTQQIEIEVRVLSEISIII